MPVAPDWVCELAADDRRSAEDQMGAGYPIRIFGRGIQLRWQVCRKEDGETLVLQTTERDALMADDPGTFYITDHYLNYDYVLIKLDKISPAILAGLLMAAWRHRAPAKLLKEFATKNTD